MNKKALVTLIIVTLCLGLLVGGIFGYKKYLDNKNSENKEPVKTNIEEDDNNETTNNELSKEIKYKVVKSQESTEYVYSYVEELSEDKYTIDEDFDNGIVTIYKKDTKEKVKEYQFSPVDGCSFNRITSNENILGYIEGHGYDNSKTKICTYLNDCFETEYKVLGEGDGLRLSCEFDFNSYNKEAIIVRKDNKVALLSLRTGKLVSDFVYDKMYGISDNHYIAVKDGKAGIIDEKFNVLVDCIYDFIDAYKEFYVVCKDGKLAIMDKNYKLVTDFSIVANFDPKDYNYTPCCGYENPLYALKVGNNYVLNTHSADYWHDTLTEDNAYMYFIKADGSYEKINNTWYVQKFNDSLFYVNNNKRTSPLSKNETIKEISTFYDNNFNKLFVVNDTDFGIVFPNFMESGSDKNKKFYDTTTGKEILTLHKYDFYNISLEYVKKQNIKGNIEWSYSVYVDGDLYLGNINSVNFNDDGSFTFYNYDYENSIKYNYELQKVS